jgi:hypothetical protein
MASFGLSASLYLEKSMKLVEIFIDVTSQKEIEIDAVAFTVTAAKRHVIHYFEKPSRFEFRMSALIKIR